MVWANITCFEYNTAKLTSAVATEDDDDQMISPWFLSLVYIMVGTNITCCEYNTAKLTSDVATYGWW